MLGLCRGLQRADVEVSVVTTTANGETELGADVTMRRSFDGVPVEYRAARLSEAIIRRAAPHGAA